MNINEAIEWINIRMCMGRGKWSKHNPPRIDEPWQAGLMAIEALRNSQWIPCSERLPKDLEVVNISWVNHRPVGYYDDIKDKPFAATAIHYNDKWWWYSPICEDLLAEYGKSECDKMEAGIEVTAWMPLPEPYHGGEEQ